MPRSKFQRSAVAIFFFALTATHAQPLFFPNVHPGSRASFYFWDGKQLFPDSLLLTAGANGPVFTIPRLLQPFEGLQAPEYLIPRDIPLGPATVEIPGKPESKQHIEVSTYPLNYIYTDRSGFAIAQQQRGSSPPRRISFTEPARPGDRITMWATGTPEVKFYPAWRDEPPIEPRVTRQTDGFDRIEFTLPDSSPAQCDLALHFQSRFLYLPTASPDSSHCPHALGIEASDLLRLDRGLTIPVALATFAPGVATVRYGNYGPSILTTSRWDFSKPAQLGCSMDPPRLFGLSVGPSGDFFQRKAEFKAPNGTVLSTQGGLVAGYTFLQVQDGIENSGLPKFGDWTFQLPADAEQELPAETVTFAVPSLSKFPNSPDWEKFSIQKDFVFEWEPGGVSEPEGYIHFEMWFRPRDWLEETRSLYISCTEPVSAGRLTVPAALMKSIDPTRYDGYFPSISGRWRPQLFRAQGNRYGALRLVYGSSPTLGFNEVIEAPER